MLELQLVGRKTPVCMYQKSGNLAWLWQLGWEPRYVSNREAALEEAEDLPR